MKRVVVTGMGSVSPFGIGVGTMMSALREGRSAVVDMSARWAEAVPGLTCLVGAPLAEEPSPKDIPRRLRRSMGPTAQMALAAAREAVGQSSLDGAQLQSGRVGVSFASTTGSIHSMDATFAAYQAGRFLEDTPSGAFFQIMSHTCAANVAHALGACGRTVSPDAACASGALAIGLGFEAVRAGAQDAMICGGADELHPLTTGCFDLVQASSHRYNDTPDLTPRPFDAARDGTVCGAGAGALVLESEDSARERGAKILAEVAGFDTLADGCHLAQPAADSIRRCIRNALDNAGLMPDRISYVNAHGTGTPAGDAAEAQAVRDVFGRGAALSSLKGHLAHTLGASGALETVASIEMMRGGFVVATRNLEEAGEDCQGPDYVMGPERQVRIDALVKNSFAFGGVNSVLVLKRYRG